MNIKKKNIIIREQVIKAIRAFFERQEFHEIIAPILNRSLPLEPNLYAFRTQWQTLKGKTNLYLPTSPEAALKKMLALGFENCYAIGPSFRNREPADVEHNPEFLMLEWYRTRADYEDIMADAQNLIIFIKDWLDQFSQKSKNRHLNYQQQDIDLSQPWPKISLAQEFKKATGKTIKQVLPERELKKLAKEFNYSTENTTWEALFNQIFTNKIEPNLSKEPLFLTDFPSKISPLCGLKENEPYLAERFELYLAGLELGNGNTEQTEAEKIRQHFQQEQAYRKKHDLFVPQVDQKFLQALNKMNQTNQSYAGIGLGVDRLAMIMADQTELSQINPFTM